MTESILEKQSEVYERAKRLSKTDPVELLNKYIGHNGRKLKVKYRMKNRKEKKEIYTTENF